MFCYNSNYSICYSYDPTSFQILKLSFQNQENTAFMQ